MVEWLEEHNYDSKQLKEREKYTIVVITIITAFIFSTFLILVYGYHASDKLRNLYIAVYAALFSIVGGLIGGLITLEGVRRTVYAQRDIESQKLIPNKIVHLNKLRRDIKLLEDTQKDIEFEKSELNYYADLKCDLDSEEMGLKLVNIIPSYRKVMELTSKPWNDIEDDFVKTVAEIDLEMYYKVSQTFKELHTEFERLKEAVAAAGIAIHFPEDGVVKTALQLYDDIIVIKEKRATDITAYEFAVKMQRGKISSGIIVNEILKSIPHLTVMDSLLKKRISELETMIDGKLKGFEKFSREIL